MAPSILPPPFGHPHRWSLALKMYPFSLLSALRWKWRCHNCGVKYCITTTRSPLTSPIVKPNPNPKRPKQLHKRRGNRTCGSTFDYTGWALFSSWRRLAFLSSSSSSSSSSHPLSFFSSSSDEEEDDAEMEKVQWTPIKTLIHRRRVVLAKERLYVDKQHICFLCCNYPSECRHLIFEAYEQGRVQFIEDDDHGCGWEVVDSEPDPEEKGKDSEMLLF
ncbi:hypothetical protein QBC36DRAFT_384140 [Triangularia setosa]|uniref:Uncharacterized protein n=1 Tax=Triangularia setosa TaxID=2587417 RepID=A0AAN6WER2_9PEZI|nr:hypothetical protein QBC36DRAFT_384140 [Podospora setosa]